MWKLGDVVDLNNLLERALEKAQAKYQSAGSVNSSWELLENEYFPIPDERIENERKIVKEWEFLEELQDRLEPEVRSYHRRTEAQIEKMAKGLLYTALAPE